MCIPTLFVAAVTVLFYCRAGWCRIAGAHWLSLSILELTLGASLWSASLMSRLMAPLLTSAVSNCSSVQNLERGRGAGVPQPDEVARWRRPTFTPRLCGAQRRSSTPSSPETGQLLLHRLILQVCVT